LQDNPSKAKTQKINYSGISKDARTTSKTRNHSQRPVSKSGLIVNGLRETQNFRNKFRLYLKSRSIPLSSLRILVMVDLLVNFGRFLGYGTAAHQPVRATCNRLIEKVDLGRQRECNEDNNTDEIPGARLLVTYHCWTCGGDILYSEAMRRSSIFVMTITPVDCRELTVPLYHRLNHAFLTQPSTIIASLFTINIFQDLRYRRRGLAISATERAGGRYLVWRSL
jgi:hypothetical protein